MVYVLSDWLAGLLPKLAVLVEGGDLRSGYAAVLSGNALHAESVLG